MSRSTQQLKEITTGIHLVILGGFTAVKNPDGTLKESETGEKLIQVRFTNGHNKHFDKQYWVKGAREHEFNKMITCAGIDRKKYGTFKEIASAATGVRLWIYIREIYEINGEECGDIMDYQIFDYSPCLNPEKKPLRKGDPEDNKGVAGGDFISYWHTKESFGQSTVHKMIEEKQEKATKSIEDLVEAAEEVLAPVKIDKKEVIAQARQMIAKVESKVKTETPKSDAINWDDYK